jgi:hypothetical protein
MSAGRHGNEYGDEYNDGSAATADAVLQMRQSPRPGSSKQISAHCTDGVRRAPHSDLGQVDQSTYGFVSASGGTWKRRVENSAASKMQSPVVKWLFLYSAC